MKTTTPRTEALSPPHRPAPTYRIVTAWAVMVGGLVGFWCGRPLMSPRLFNGGQLAALLATWKVASLLCLPTDALRRFTPLRFLAYLAWPGMQPRQFLTGAQASAGAPVPTVRGFLRNVSAGAALLLLAARVLPAATPRAVRFWVALVGFGMLFLVARLDIWALAFRWMGFAVEKLWDCPVAATSLGDFWGRRWNRIVSGFLREVVFMPVARRAGSKAALLAVFLYSGLYHEMVSFLAGSGYDGRMLYFLVQYLGVASESSGPGRRALRGRPWLGRAWALAVVVAPVGQKNPVPVPLIWSDDRVGTAGLPPVHDPAGVNIAELLDRQSIDGIAGVEQEHEGIQRDRPGVEWYPALLGQKQLILRRQPRDQDHVGPTAHQVDVCLVRAVIMNRFVNAIVQRHLNTIIFIEIDVSFVIVCPESA